MNYYKRHIGDYMKDASHLSLLEHGVYMRLLDVYYTREAAIPVDQAARLIGARSKDEKEALLVVAHEFFTVVDGCYTQARCDREIATAKEFSEEANGRKANETERQQRHRARRKEMFDTLRSRGIVPAWDASTEKLKQLLSAPVTPPVTPPVTIFNAPDTAIANSQEPVTNNQIPARAGIGRATEAEACLAMKAAGMASVNPSSPKLTALLDAGITLAELTSAAAEATEKGKPFAYALALAEGRRRDAAVEPLPSARAAVNRHKYAAAAAAIFDFDDAPRSRAAGEVIDV